MKAIILDLTSASGADTNLLYTSVSFERFIRYVKETAKSETSIRKSYLENAVDILTAEPGFALINKVQDAARYEPLLNVIYQLLTPTLNQKGNLVWAIGMPLSPVMFYGTDGFYEMVLNAQTGELRSEMISSESVNISLRDKVIPIYSLILERLYGVMIPDHQPMVIRIRDMKTGIPQYFRINLDHRFTDVYPIEELPELDQNVVGKLLNGEVDVEPLLQLLPVSHFRFEGISIITLTDVTTEYTLETIKNIVIERHKSETDAFYWQITDALRTLAAHPGIEFGFIPQLRVNNKPVIDRKTIFHSKLLSIDLPEKDFADIYFLFADHFLKNPGISFTQSHQADERLNNFTSTIQSAGIQYYTIKPIYYGLHIVGLFEIYSLDKIAPEQNIFSRVSPAEPLISAIFQTTIDEFKVSLETVVMKNFTAVQPAVQWKFNQAAWHFLRDGGTDKLASMEKITFPDVYPLYGAVDIRNSTIARNTALKEDLHLQFTSLTLLFQHLSLDLGLLVPDEMTFKCNEICEQIQKDADNIDIIKITEFLHKEVHPFLQHFLNGLPAGKSIADPDESHQLRSTILDYFNILDHETGAAHANRRGLEKSMQMINTTVSHALDQFKTQVEPIYPAYFEKFRTDGVEYDIFIGQSIEPEKEFSPVYVKNVKLWQLSSMASMTRMTHSLLPLMEKPLQTTQLIFVNSGTIDISFRDDERRFDVEGAHNIRYQVIKKRIDKACVAHTGERLTQPGRIALVYFQNKSIADYLDHIRYLQAQHVLCDDLEFLELEELQGVSGISALRIGVVMDKV